jgi:hypothetical protein
MILGKCSNEPQNVSTGIFVENDNVLVLCYKEHTRTWMYKFNEAN